jgi:outer membrane protein TolC
MFRWHHRFSIRRKSGWSAWISAGASLVVAAGCHTIPEQEERIDSHQAAHQAVSVYPKVPLLNSNSVKPSITESQRAIIRPVQAVETIQNREPPISTGQPTNGEPPGVLAAGGVPGAICSSPPVLNALDLVTALRLAGIDNPTINLAQERIREALAQQLNARVLLLPNLNIGGNYHYNNGPIQSSTGEIVNVANQVLYLGGGAGAIGSQTVAIPGIWLFAHLGNAVYEPLAAQQNLTARRSDSLATQNTVMGDVVTAYLQLVGSEARLDVLRRTDVEGAEVVRLTSEYAKAGQGRSGDANRAKAFNELVERERRAAQGDVEVASARLCRLLSIDPTNQFRTPGAQLETFRLIPEDTDAEVLIEQALRARPELAAGFATIEEARVRVRQEKVRPFLPTLSLGVSTGAFGGGSDLVTPGFSQLAGRTDIDLMAIWNVQNLGFGNRARVREANAGVAQTMAEYEEIKNRVRREVMDALADARAAARQLDLAQAAVFNSTEGFNLDLQRIKGGAGGVGGNDPRPIELLDSFQELLDARLALVAAVTTYDIAQFRLFVALGSNPLNAPDVSQLVPLAVPSVPVRAAAVPQQDIPVMQPPGIPVKP